MRIPAIVTIAATTLLGCAATPGGKADTITKDDLSAFIDTMVGEFETLPENKDTQILDRRVRVSSPFLEGNWIYSQLNTGPDKKVYRQRVSSLDISDDGQAIIQKSYSLSKPGTFTEFWTQSNMFASLSENDLQRFANEGCVQKWTKTIDSAWRGYVDPNICLIRSKRRNIDIRIEAEAQINGDTYKTNERGFTVDMEQIWGSEPGEFIVLKRNH